MKKIFTWIAIIILWIFGKAWIKGMTRAFLRRHNDSFAEFIRLFFYGELTIPVVLLLLFFIFFFVVKKRLKKSNATKLQRVGFVLISISVPLFLTAHSVYTIINQRTFNYELYKAIRPYTEVFAMLCYIIFPVGLFLFCRVQDGIYYGVQKLYGWINGPEE